jgi:HlyD family type I secretion membrane fusion protein
MSKLSSKVLVSWLNKLFTLNGLLGGKSQSDADHAKAADSSTDVSNSVEVEKVEAERVDPDAPLPLSEADEEMNAENSAEPEETPRPGLVKWIKMKIYYFFFPPPMLVPVQLKTPEVDMDAASEPLPLRGQLIYILIGAFFFIAVIWAAITTIDEVVRAEGVVVPSENVQIVQSRLPGSVTDIRIKLGDKVAKDDVLFKIEDEDVKANFADNEIQRLAALASIQRLEAEAQGLAQLNMPEWLVKAAPDAVRQEEEVFASRRRALENERQVIFQQIETLRRAIDVQKSEESLARIHLTQIDQERAIIAPLVKAGHEPKLALINLESRYQETLGRAEKARLEAVHSGSELITQERRLASLNTNFQADAETRLIETRMLAAQTEARLDALEGKVQQTEVKSPVHGTVSAVHFSTIGGVVDAGAVLAEIVPIEEEVTIEAQVMTQDVADIYPGLPVRISLSASDVSRYGAMEGIVEKIATNSTQKENQPPYYQTIIRIPDPVFPLSGLKPEITPGMPVVVDVLGGKRTVLDYILSPIERAQTIIFREK